MLEDVKGLVEEPPSKWVLTLLLVGMGDIQAAHRENLDIAIVGEDGTLLLSDKFTQMIAKEAALQVEGTLRSVYYYANLRSYYAEVEMTGNRGWEPRPPGLTIKGTIGVEE